TLETFSLERCPLRVTDPGFDFSFAIGILDPARQGHRTVVGEHIAIERVQGGIVDVGFEVAIIGRIWVATEDTRTLSCSLIISAGHGPLFTYVLREDRMESMGAQGLPHHASA